MRGHEKAGLTLQHNGITFKNGEVIPEERLIETNVVGSKDYKEAKNVKSGQPNSVLDLGNGLVTFSDTEFIFPIVKIIFGRMMNY